MKRTSFSAVIFATLTMLVGLLSGLDRTFAADDAKAFRMIVGEPRFMDPNLATDYSIYVNAQLFEPLARIDNTGKSDPAAGEEHRGRARRSDVDDHAQPRLQMVERPADHRRRLGIFLEAYPRPEAEQ